MQSGTPPHIRDLTLSLEQEYPRELHADIGLIVLAYRAILRYSAPGLCALTVGNIGTVFHGVACPAMVRDAVKWLRKLRDGEGSGEFPMVLMDSDGDVVLEFEE